MPAHGPQHTLQKVRDCLKTGQPEILWQPYFDKAKEVLVRSLLVPKTTVPPPDGD